MTLRDSILRVYVALACLSCARDRPAAENDAGAKPALTTLPPQATSALTPASAGHPTPAPAAWAVAYDDKSDAPENAGDARCPAAPAANAKPASVKVDLVASPPAVELAIPSLGVKQRLWPGASQPSECHAALADGGKAIRFHCSEDLSSVDGKLYVRRSDVLLGRANPAGTATTKFVLPCGTPAKLEPIGCPASCTKGSDQSCRCGTRKK